jgi:hypothetical protein
MVSDPLTNARGTKQILSLALRPEPVFGLPIISRPSYMPVDTTRTLP